MDISQSLIGSSGFGLVKPNLDVSKVMNIKVPKVAPTGLSPALSAGLGMGANLLGGIAGKAIAGGLSSGVGDAISGLSGLTSLVPGPLGTALGGGVQLVGGLVNRVFGSKLNQANINQVENNINSLNNFTTNATDFDTLGNTMLSAPTSMAFDNSFIGKDGLLSKKVKRKANALRNQQSLASAFVDNSLTNNMYNIQESDIGNDLANYAALGGQLEFSNGSDWNTGITLINNGGTHEQNPYKGVPIGVDEQGNPNLVEEGEVVWKDYVFSNRIPVSEELAKQFKVKGNHLTFADIAKKIQKNMAERPNDPITKRGVEHSLQQLQALQETYKQAQAQGQEGSNNMFSDGGTINPYKFSTSWKGFDYRNGDKYDEGYLNFANNINQDWVNRIMKGTYGSMDRYLATNKDTMPTPIQVSKLATDNKYSDMHKAVGAAYKDSLRGIDPVTGLVPTNNSTNNAATPSKPMTIYTTFGRPGGDISIAPWAISKYGYSLPDDNTWTTKDEQGNTVKFLSKNPNKPNQNKVTPERDVPNYDNWAANLRYAPVLGAGIGVLGDLLGKNSTPDYSNANALLEASKSVKDINPYYIGDYMSYNPLDREFYINQLNATSSANRRGIVNNSGGNRGQAMAGLLASDYGAQNQLGQLARQAEEYNLGQRAKVTEFNRGTNMFNAEQDYKAQSFNNQNSNLRYNAAAQAAQLRDNILARAAASRSANLTNLFDNLGNIGIDTINRQDRDRLIRAGVFGTLSQKPSGWSDKRWQAYQNAVQGKGFGNETRAYGGSIKTKKKKGLTI